MVCVCVCVCVCEKERESRNGVCVQKNTTLGSALNFYKTMVALQRPSSATSSNGNKTRGW